jgi:hypothetical protein
MEVRILSEYWMPDIESYRFRCLTGSGSWTFCVDQRTLEELDDDAYFDRAGVFDALRPRIYKVARSRIASGEPAGRHVISAGEIRQAGRLLQRSETGA